jgi:hypothetical protein
MSIFKKGPMKASGGNKLNMVIAKTHQLSGRLVGMQITGGNFIGIVLSMVQMSVGFVFITSGLTNGYPPAVGMVMVVGCALAILVERLSIVGLASVREAKADRKKCLDQFYRLAIKKEPTTWEIEAKDRRVAELDKDIRAGWWFGGMGMFLSVLVGDIFWHKMFESLGQWYVVLPMSLACAAVIGVTFVNSELFKEMLDRVLKAILRDLHLMKAAVAVEEQNMQLDMLAASMQEVRSDEARRQPLEDKIGKVVVRRLSGFADHFGDLILDDTVVEAAQPLQIAPPTKRRTQYDMHKEEMRQLLAANPAMSLQDLANHFGKPKTTMQGWMEKLKAGV